MSSHLLRIVSHPQVEEEAPSTLLILHYQNLEFLTPEPKAKYMSSETAAIPYPVVDIHFIDNGRISVSSRSSWER